MLSGWLLLLSITQASAFSENFKWCVATAAHQIEGENTQSDWWQWEQQPGKIKNGDRSGRAVDHWNRVSQDISLLKQINANTYRLSIEWAKIEPSQGEISVEAVNHYRDELKALRVAGIEPLVTLHHFTFPKWVSERGGFEWAGLPEAMAHFANIAYRNFGDLVQDWITINEPTAVLAGGYVAGVFPPGEKRKLQNLLAPAKGILAAHKAAYSELHQLAIQSTRPIRVGLAWHLRQVSPKQKWNPLDQMAAAFSDYLMNWYLIDEVEKEGLQDFLGINYYTGDLVSFHPKTFFKIHHRSEIEQSDLGWDILPEGFGEILSKAHRRYPRLSMMITENGIADSRDLKRSKYLIDHLEQVRQALKNGVPIEGYCHWTLMDNFEWAEGFSARFGLFETNFETLERLPRPSAQIFADYAASRR